MKVARVREVLTDKLGADDLAVFLDQAPIRLTGEEKLREPGHAQGIGQACDDRHQDDHDDSGSDLSQHYCSPQARPAADTAISISLMPMNGTMIPPTP